MSKTSETSIKFGDQKAAKSYFYKGDKKLFKIDGRHSCQQNINFKNKNLMDKINHMNIS